jgi:phage baseplate assembly protein W
MKTLALAGGDLVVGPNGHRTVTGSSKIRQDLALALGEPLGHDRFHPEWGSVLPNYVGRPITADTELLVRSEANRVVQVYIDVQKNEIVNDSLAGRRSRFTTADVVARLDDIQTSLTFDTIRVKLKLVTQSQETLTVAKTVETT